MSSDLSFQALHAIDFEGYGTEGGAAPVPRVFDHTPRGLTVLGFLYSPEQNWGVETSVG